MAHSGYYTDLASYENVNQLVETAEAYAVSAGESADQAAISATDAASSATDAATQSSSASTFANAAADSATASAGSASSAAASAVSATSSETNAASSASAAATSASNAASSASAAATSASNAASTLAASMLKANNLSDVANVNTARTNLGVNNQTGPYATASGSANAIILTTNYAPAKQTALVAGHQVRARIAATNTGATTMALDGLAAKSCVTVINIALPAGYIRTDIDTLFTYDAIGDRWIVSREVQYGSNANGEFWRYADGSLHCRKQPLATVDVTTANGSLFMNSAALTWTHPAAFSADCVCSGSSDAAVLWVTGAGGTTTSLWRIYAATNNQLNRAMNVEARGRWY